MGIYRQFPYTNFHDMNLDWILENMRKLLTEWSEHQEKWEVLYDDVTTAFDDFKSVFDEHIAQYDAEFSEFINSIDVNKELRTVFDQAVADGTVASIINPVIATKTAEWLDANITEPVGVVIDKSLTVDGACADAKATGDKIGNLKSNIDAILDARQNVDYTIIKNQYPALDGTFPTFANWDRTDYVPVNPGETLYFGNPGRDCTDNIWYDENKTPIKKFGIFIGDPFITTVPDNAHYMVVSNSSLAFYTYIRRNIENLVSKTIFDNEIKRTIRTLNQSNYISSVSNFTSDGTNDLNKISTSIFTPVVSLSAENKPADFSHGFLLAVCATTGTNGEYQALFSGKGELLYYRAKWTYDSEWGEFISAQSTKNDALNFAEAFRKVSVVGDSITIGYMPNVGGTGGITNTEYAWQNYVFSKANITTCAKGGASAKTFFTDTELNASLNNLPTDSQCVAIYLGTNPVTDDNDETLPYGDSSDVVASYDDTPTETWVGYYSKLIKTIQHNLPNTPIIVIGLAVLTERNACIELSADACGVIYISAHDYVDNDWNIPDNNDWWHCTAIGYIGRANVMRKSINNAISENLATFNAIQTIN